MCNGLPWRLRVRMGVRLCSYRWAGLLGKHVPRHHDFRVPNFQTLFSITTFSIMGGLSFMTNELAGGASEASPCCRCHGGA